MIIRKDTKEILADSLKELMKKMPMDKISIKDIVANCGTTRQTFYNNFKDKYDLISWVYQVDVAKCNERIGGDYNWFHASIDNFRYMLENKFFYTHAITLEGQNSLTEYFYQRAICDSIDVIKKKYGPSILDDKLLFDLAFYFHGSVHMRVEWIKSGMKLSPEELAKRLSDCMPDSVNKLLLS